MGISEVERPVESKRVDGRWRGVRQRRTEGARPERRAGRGWHRSVLRHAERVAPRAAVQRDRFGAARDGWLAGQRRHVLRKTHGRALEPAVFCERVLSSHTTAPAVERAVDSPARRARCAASCRPARSIRRGSRRMARRPTPSCAPKNPWAARRASSGLAGTPSALRHELPFSKTDRRGSRDVSPLIASGSRYRKEQVADRAQRAPQHRPPRQPVSTVLRSNGVAVQLRE